MAPHRRSAVNHALQSSITIEWRQHCTTGLQLTTLQSSIIVEAWQWHCTTILQRTTRYNTAPLWQPHLQQTSNIAVERVVVAPRRRVAADHLL